MSPTQRTLSWLREQGYEAGVVERHNTFSGRKTDLFGVIDIVSVRPGQTVGVQACAAGDIARREKKIHTEAREKARAWLLGGNELWVVGWRRYKQAVWRKYWRPVVREVTLADLEG